MDVLYRKAFLKAAIEELPGAEFVEIRKWVAERAWQIWDREVQADSKAGRESRQVLVSKGRARPQGARSPGRA